MAVQWIAHLAGRQGEPELSQLVKEIMSRENKIKKPLLVQFLSAPFAPTASGALLLR